MKSMRKIFLSYCFMVISYIGIKAEGNYSLQNNKDIGPDDVSANDLKSDIICRENQTYVWCIPPSYNNREEPWRYRALIKASFP